jgi:hypothetical protein
MLIVNVDRLCPLSLSIVYADGGRGRRKFGLTAPPSN